MQKTIRHQCYLFLIVIFLFPTFIFAQISNCNGFIKGNYVEAGVNWNGAFGSSNRPPAGYHPERQSTLYNAPACGGALHTDTALGFVADPYKDGWNVGTIPHFGDYILPGTTQEGWSYMADGVQIDAWNALAASVDTLTGGMTSGIISYSDTLGVRQIKTQAVKGGIYLTHIYTIDTGDLFIKVEVIIDNTSVSTVSNIVYMRTVNPHNDQSISGNSGTINKIDYNLPDSLNRVVVSARGITNTDAYLALATQDVRMNPIPFIYKNSGLPNSTTIDNIYAGDANYLYNKDDSNTMNTSIGIIYDIGNMNSGDAKTFNYIYAFNKSVIDSTLNVVDSHLAVRNAYPSHFNVYPNPATNTFKIAGLQHGDAIDVYDMMGKKVCNYTYTGANSFNISECIPGSYMLIIRDRFGAVLGRMPLLKE